MRWIFVKEGDVEERGTSRTGLYVLLVVALIAFLAFALVFTRGMRDTNGGDRGPNGNNGEGPPVDPPPEDSPPGDANTVGGRYLAPGYG
jgi:hypothetical protein